LQWLFKALDTEFGFTLDPCATHENAKCSLYFTKAEDGLKQAATVLITGARTEK
jgi:site-specific DNA-methyltransferase (adenine-specific)